MSEPPRHRDEVDHDRVSEIFVEIVDMPPAERSVRLDALCDGDESLRREVDSLLAHHDHTSLDLEPVLHPPTPSGELVESLDRAARQAIPARIGRYRIVERLGEGGMGVVYRAEQERPMRREVALKVIKPGMDSAAIVARFDAERQALALMEHPGVARVLDGGSTDDGRPYFVMEFVHGEPITAFCDRHRLTIAQRVALLIGVCEAVQHAHQKGIIHRDLKPSNILVERHDGRAHARVIDFGVAKALAGGAAGALTDLTLMTHVGQIVGTPSYMSPEQAEAGAGGDVDTRSDVWSLGVILYELLAGATPIDGAMLRQRSVLEVARLITEHDPPKPTTRLAQLGSADPSSLDRIATARRCDPTALRRMLTRELGWIAMKCLERDRARRYESVAELARDLRRHLDGEPVLAVPPSRLYRLGKFVRRNRVPVAATGAVALTLVAATAVSLRFGLREAEQRTVVERQRAELAEIVEFQAEMLGSISPVAMGRGLVEQMRDRMRRSLELGGADEAEVGMALAALDEALGHVSPTDLALDAIDTHVLRTATATLGDRFRGQPLAEAALRHTIARIYDELGLVAEARPQIELALALRRTQLGATHLDTMRTERLLASSELRLDVDREAAATRFARVIETFERELGPADPETLDTMMARAAALRAGGWPAEAEETIRTVHARAVEALGEDDAVTLHALAELGSLLFTSGDAAAGEPILATAHRLAERTHGADSQLALRIANDLSQALMALRRLDEAEAMARRALEGRRTTLGRDHPYTLTSLNNLGVIVRRAGRTDEAESLYRDALDTSRRLHGATHPTTLSLKHNLAVLKQSTGRLDEAEPLLAETLSVRRRLLGRDHPETLRSLNAYGGLLHLRGRHDMAIAAFREAIATLESIHPSDHPDLLRVHHNLGGCLAAKDDHAAAESHYRIAHEGRAATLGPGHRDTLNSALGLARALHGTGRLDEARTLVSASRAEAERSLGAGNPVTAALARLADELADGPDRASDGGAVVVTE